MLAQRSTTIKLSQEAAAKLPRIGFWSLLAIFSLVGLFAQDLWTPRDIDSFGDAWLLAQQPLSAWLTPSAYGESLTRTGPLTIWLTAVLMKTLGEQGFGLISEVSCLRLAAVFWFTLTTFAIWESAYRLARRPEAQPIAFAFGGEAKPRDFARSIADCAVLLFVATFGILTRQHEAVPDTALLSIAALNLLGLTYTIRRPLLGCVLTGMTVCASILASTLFAGVWLLAQSVIVVSTLTNRPRKRDVCLVVLVLTAGLSFCLWPLLSWVADAGRAADWFSEWALTQTDYFGPAGLSTYLWFAKHSLWFLLPIWPLVVMGLVRWGKRLTQPFLFLPVVVFAVTLLGVIFSSRQSTDSVFLACLPALAVFAAFSLLTIKQGWENTLDWFGLTIFTLAGLTIWLYWIAWLTGIPPKMHQSIVHLAPTVRPAFDTGLILALAMTVCWAALLVWRLTHRPVAIWRGPWINAAGMTFVVVAGFGLFSTATTEYRSLSHVAGTLDNLIVRSGWNAGDCVQPVRISPETVAVLRYHGGTPLQSLSNDAACRFVMLKLSPSEKAKVAGFAPSAGRNSSGNAFTVIERSEFNQSQPSLVNRYTP